MREKERDQRDNTTQSASTRDAKKGTRQEKEEEEQKEGSRRASNGIGLAIQRALCSERGERKRKDDMSSTSESMSCITLGP
jgi:hypothetical protein